MQVSKNLDYVCQIDTYLYEKRVGFLLPAVKAWLVEICGWWTESDWFHRTQCWFCGYTFPHFHELCESLQPRRGLLRPLWAYVHITLDTIAEMQTYVNYCLSRENLLWHHLFLSLRSLVPLFFLLFERFHNFSIKIFCIHLTASRRCSQRLRYILRIVQ